MDKRNIGIELRSINNLIMRYMENHANKKKVDSITGTNGWIIGYIAENHNRDVYQRDLEAEFSITRSTASKVINLMVQKGLIVRESVPHDARLKKLVLTDKAHEISCIMKQDGAVMNDVLIHGFSKDELDDLYSFLKRMKANIS